MKKILPIFKLMLSFLVGLIIVLIYFQFNEPNNDKTIKYEYRMITNKSDSTFYKKQNFTDCNICVLPNEKAAFDFAKVLFERHYHGYGIDYNYPIQCTLVNNHLWIIDAKVKGSQGFYEMTAKIIKDNGRVVGIVRTK